MLSKFAPLRQENQRIATEGRIHSYSPITLPPSHNS